MAVTKKTKSLAILGVLTPLMLLGFQNCMVDLAKSTPGASSVTCSPTTTQLSDFQLVESAILANTTSFPSAANSSLQMDGCASCHGQNATNAGKSSFLILTTSSGTLDTTTSTANFCTMKLKSHSKLLHPSESSHSGGVFSTADMPSYYTLINNYF